MRAQKLFSIVVGGFVTLSSAVGANTLRETAHGPDTADTVVNIDGGFMIADGTAAPGVNFGIARRLTADTPLYIGADLGAYIATGSSSYAVLPMLGDIHYQFMPVASVHPLLGLLAGPVLATGGGYSTARFGALIRPGINVELGKRAALNVEGRFGAIGSDFVFIPQVGAIFPL